MDGWRNDKKHFSYCPLCYTERESKKYITMKEWIFHFCRVHGNSEFRKEIETRYKMFQ